MLKLCVMFFVFKLDVHIKVYKLIKKKHQQDLFEIVQNFEKKKIIISTKFLKIEKGTSYIKSCK